MRVQLSAYASRVAYAVRSWAHALTGHRHGLVSRTNALALGGVVGLGGLGGGGGLSRLIVHLFIWRLIRRAGVGLWRVPTVGPFLVVALVAVIVGLLVFLKHRRQGGW